MVIVGIVALIAIVGTFMSPSSTRSDLIVMNAEPAALDRSRDKV